MLLLTLMTYKATEIRAIVALAPNKCLRLQDKGQPVCHPSYRPPTLSAAKKKLRTSLAHKGAADSIDSSSTQARFLRMKYQQLRHLRMMMSTSAVLRSSVTALCHICVSGRRCLSQALSQLSVTSCHICLSQALSAGLVVAVGYHFKSNSPNLSQRMRTLRHEKLAKRGLDAELPMFLYVCVCSSLLREPTSVGLCKPKNGIQAKPFM